MARRSKGVSRISNELRLQTLKGKVALVTGGTFGVGRGIARELATHGARVFVTGRSANEQSFRENQITAIQCDHRSDREVEAAFAYINREAGGPDVLVNSVWGGYERMVEDGIFTW